MATFALICLSVMATCSVIITILLTLHLEDITNFLQSINVKSYQIEAKIHEICFYERSKLTSKQEKNRKKHSCYDERDLK